VQHRADGAALAAISQKVAPGRHAALLLDQAGWHVSAKLLVPNNITIVPLQAKCPERRCCMDQQLSPERLLSVFSKIPSE